VGTTKKGKTRRRLSRQEQRDLDIEIQFLEGLVRRDPTYTEALQILGDDYTRRGRFAEGLNVDLQLARLNPRDALTHYNLACSYVLTERFEDAVQALDRAIDLGYRNFSWLARDPDLAALRRHPLYRRIRAKVRSLRAQVA
jgi:tetratricopeptide (TPR) repeat protein